MWVREVIEGGSILKLHLSDHVAIPRDRLIMRQLGFYARNVSQIPQSMLVSDLKLSCNNWNFKILYDIICDDDVDE